MMHNYSLQEFSNALTTAFKKVEIHNISKESIKCISMETANIIWKWISLPDPMILILKTVSELKDQIFELDTKTCQINGGCTNNLSQRVIAFASPAILNSFQGKTIEKASVFVG